MDRNHDCLERCCLFYIPWLRLQNKVFILVSDPLFDLFITLSILVNTIFMGIEYHNMPQELVDATSIGNFVSHSLAQQLYTYRTGRKKSQIYISISSIVFNQIFAPCHDIFFFYFQVFTIIFTVEAVLKLCAFGKFYFSNGWNNFDLVIVVASWLDFGLSDVEGVNVIRTFRLVSDIL